MKTQKELKEKYMNIIKTEIWRNDERMQEFARKESEYIVELSNGNIIRLSKPRIQKDFCYGMGMYATYTDEDFEAAEGLAQKARTDIDFFIENNMKQITEKIESLEEAKRGEKECYTFINYSGQPANSDLMTYKVCGIGYNPEFSPAHWQHLTAVRKLSVDDIQSIIDGLQEVANKFLKRLNTYLKKYGLDKLNVWTYCRD